MDFNSLSPTELRELYEKSPDDFNEFAAGALRRACIGSTNEQTLKLRQLQWTIDARLMKAKTPLGRLHVMENIFYGKVYGRDGLLSQLVSAYDSLRAVTGTNDIPQAKPALHLLRKEQ